MNTYLYQKTPRSIRWENEGPQWMGWAANVCFGPRNNPTTVRRYLYETRAQARNADISHNIGECGRLA